MTRNGDRPDLLVVGGGVIGLSVARDVARRGLRVTVLDRDEPGRGASWAAAGMLSPLAEAHASRPFLEFGLASLRMYGDWVRELESEVGESVEYRECGKLLLAFTRSGSARLDEQERLARRYSVSASRAEPEWLRREDPDLARSVRGALLVEEDYRVDNRLLVRALEGGARRARVEIRAGTAVREIRIQGDRALGVILEDGSSLDAGTILVAAGAWSGRLEGLSRTVPIRPVRGQMLSLAPEQLPSRRMLEAEEGYLVPRDDGRLLVGGTMEEVGFRPGNTVRGIRELLESAIHLVPSLESAPIVDFWSGFRPASIDGHPILGPDPEVRDLFVATGHYRNGILLAPLTARTMGAVITGETEASLPPEFLPSRLLAHEGSGGAS